jgi:hypothetical protein
MPTRSFLFDKRGGKNRMLGNRQRQETSSDNTSYPLTIRLMDEAAPNVGKTRLSISEAANHAQVNRTYFYQKYITPGLIVPHVDERGKKYIELGELIFAVG